jgi:hypothetical protein
VRAHGLDWIIAPIPEDFPVKAILAVVIILSTLSFAQDSSMKPMQPAAQLAADMALR